MTRCQKQSEELCNDRKAQARKPPEMPRESALFSFCIERRLLQFVQVRPAHLHNCSTNGWREALIVSCRMVAMTKSAGHLKIMDKPKICSISDEWNCASSVISDDSVDSCIEIRLWKVANLRYSMFRGASFRQARGLTSSSSGRQKLMQSPGDGIA